jgi:hypothetical protein
MQREIVEIKQKVVNWFIWFSFNYSISITKEAIYKIIGNGGPHKVHILWPSMPLSLVGSHSEAVHSPNGDYCCIVSCLDSICKYK